MTTDNRTPITLTWGDEKLYRCRLCAFDTFDKAVFEDHFRKVHAPFEVLEARQAAVDDLHSMTVAELKDKAEADGIDLDSSAKKADIIAAIEAAPKE